MQLWQYGYGRKRFSLSYDSREDGESLSAATELPQTQPKGEKKKRKKKEKRKEREKNKRKREESNRK